MLLASLPPKRKMHTRALIIRGGLRQRVDQPEAAEAGGHAERRGGAARLADQSLRVIFSMFIEDSSAPTARPGIATTKESNRWRLRRAEDSALLPAGTAFTAARMLARASDVMALCSSSAFSESSNWPGGVRIRGKIRVSRETHRGARADRTVHKRIHEIGAHQRGGRGLQIKFRPEQVRARNVVVRREEIENARRIQDGFAHGW